MIFGIFLIVIGIVWLLSNLGYIATEISQIIWPAIFIAFGLSLIIKKKRHHYLKHWFFDSSDIDPDKNSDKKNNDIME